MVLDEPNANLDEAGEAALAKAILELKGDGVTVVVVTHRKSILACVDKLLVLNDGTVAAYGPREAVLQVLQGDWNSASRLMQTEI